jgi:hypothetical protein
MLSFFSDSFLTVFLPCLSLHSIFSIHFRRHPCRKLSDKNRAKYIWSILRQLPFSFEIFLEAFMFLNHAQINFWEQHCNVGIKTQKPDTLVGFEPRIFCSGGGRDDRYAAARPRFFTEAPMLWMYWRIKNLVGGL